MYTCTNVKNDFLEHLLTILEQLKLTTKQYVVYTTYTYVYMYVGSGEILYDTQQSEFYKRETRNSCKISNKINNSFISCIRNL